MEGFDVATSDDERWGHVVGESGENLIVEHGHLRKHKHALPRTFIHVDADARLVRTTLSKDLLANSPRLDDDDVGEDQIAAYYGLSEDQGPEGGPEGSADQQALDAGIEPADMQRARIQRDIGGGEPYGDPGRQIIPPDPHKDR
jgi:hypothetical protein